MLSLILKNGMLAVNYIRDYKLFQQLKKEARIDGSCKLADYDKLLTAAAKQGIGLEVIES